MQIDLLQNILIYTLYTYNIYIIHCLTSDTDPTSPHRLLCHRGKTCVFTGRKTLQLGWGRKNPMSHLSRMKNPNLPYPSVAAALRAYVLCPASLDVLATLGTTASFSGLSRLGFTTSQLCLANCLPCLVAFVSHILTIPYVLSLVLTLAIYAMPPPPLRPIEGVRGIHPFQPLS